MEKKEIVKLDGTPVVTEIFEYDLNTQTLKTLYGVVVEKRHFASCNQKGLVAASYAIEVKPILMTKKKVIQYDPNNANITTTNVTEYDYTIDINGGDQNEFDILLSAAKSYNENLPGLKYLSNFLYPGDYSPTDANASGVIGGIYGLRIPADNYIPSHKSLFSQFVPGNVDFELINTSSYIENSGLIDTQTAFGSTTTNFNYDALGLVASTSITNDQLTRTTSISSNAFTGPDSSTDTNNRTLSFTYDKKQRLSTVSDHDNNVVERKTYVDGNTVAVLIDGPGIDEIQNPVTFHVSDPFSYGTTTFFWDMDDGSTYSTTNRNVTHTYFDEGVKMVKVNATNAEANFSVSGSRGIAIKYVAMTVGGIGLNVVSSDSCSRSLTFSVNASGGCNSNYSYEWSHRINGGPWESFALGAPIEVFHFIDINLEVRVTVSNPGCGDEPITKFRQLFFNGCLNDPLD